MVLRLIRFLDDSVNPNGESLIVEAECQEVMRLPWNEDLKEWFGAHEKEIDEDGDVNVFLEYRRRRGLFSTST